MASHVWQGRTLLGLCYIKSLKKCTCIYYFVYSYYCCFSIAWHNNDMKISWCQQTLKKSFFFLHSTPAAAAVTLTELITARRASANKTLLNVYYYCITTLHFPKSSVAKYYFCFKILLLVITGTSLHGLAPECLFLGLLRLHAPGCSLFMAQG